MALKLSYCQLIKIILSQIGGSPLQQTYTQLSQGLKQMTTRGLFPTELVQLKNLIDQVTTAINAAASELSAAEQMASHFLQNPVGTATTQAIAAIDSRIAQITETVEGGVVPISGKEEEYADLVAARANFVSFKTHTDRLAGVSALPDGGQFGGCTLADLLGDGCTPAGNVPDVDLQTIIDGFKSGALITAAKNDIIRMVDGAVGYSQIKNSLDVLQNQISVFNNTITSKLNKLIIKRAVENYINQLAFSLLSGCSNQLLDLTLKTDVKAAIAPYAAMLQKQQEGTQYTDSSGTVVTTTDTPLST